MSSVLDNGDAPTISVLLPVYNAQRYIRAAVESVLAQTYRNFELLALDDGSTDQSASILRELSDRDSRLDVISRENRGLVSTLNELASRARGPYLARMDADDICRPQRFEKQLAYMEAHPDCVALGTGTLLVDPDGQPICEHRFELAHEDIDRAHLQLIQGRICHPSVMLRRDTFLKVGGYREDCKLAEDFDLWLRLAEIGRLTNLPDVLLEYRHHFSSVCYANTDEQRKIGLQIVSAALQRRHQPVAFETLDVPMQPQSPADTHRKWAWWALSAGNVATARKHAFMALVKQPVNKDNLIVVACALRGR